jgi:hydroxypyruvate isomerase
MNRRDFNRDLAGVLGATTAAGARFLSGTSPREATKQARFKCSVMLWTVFRQLPFEQRLEKVAEAGYRYVELVGEYKGWSEEDFRRVNSKRRELGISFDASSGLAHGVGNPNERDAFVADLRSELAVMEKIDCPALIIMSGNVVPGMLRQQQHQSCIDGLRRAADLIDARTVGGKKVELLLENIDPEENPKYYLQSVTEGLEIVRAVNHPQVRFLYDFYHEQIAEGNLIEKLEKHVDLVGLVHIADVPGRHEPGTGEINYTNVYRKLGELNYERFVAMEFLPSGDAVQALRSAQNHALEAAASA